MEMMPDPLTNSLAAVLLAEPPEPKVDVYSEVFMSALSWGARARGDVSIDDPVGPMGHCACPETAAPAPHTTETPALPDEGMPERRPIFWWLRKKWPDLDLPHKSPMDL